MVRRLKKLQKYTASVKPRQSAIFETFHLVYFSNILASCATRLPIKAVVVWPVVSFSTQLKWLTWTASWSA